VFDEKTGYTSVVSNPKATFMAANELVHGTGRKKKSGGAPVLVLVVVLVLVFPMITPLRPARQTTPSDCGTSMMEDQSGRLRAIPIVSTVSTLAPMATNSRRGRTMKPSEYGTFETQSYLSIKHLTHTTMMSLLSDTVQTGTT